MTVGSGLALRGLRGATTCSANTVFAIEQAVSELGTQIVDDVAEQHAVDKPHRLLNERELPLSGIRATITSLDLPTPRVMLAEGLPVREGKVREARVQNGIQ